MPEDEKLEVHIIDRRDVTLPTAEGEPKIEVWLTYRYGTLPPGLVRIPKDQDTPDEEARRIKADIQARLAAKPEVLKV